MKKLLCVLTLALALPLISWTGTPNTTMIAGKNHTTYFMSGGYSHSLLKELKLQLDPSQNGAFVFEDVVVRVKGVKSAVKLHIEEGSMTKMKADAVRGGASQMFFRFNNTEHKKSKLADSKDFHVVMVLANREDGSLLSEEENFEVKHYLESFEN